jgi:hypothetical protein
MGFAVLRKSVRSWGPRNHLLSPNGSRCPECTPNYPLHQFDHVRIQRCNYCLWGSSGCGTGPCYCLSLPQLANSCQPPAIVAPPCGTPIALLLLFVLLRQTTAGSIGSELESKKATAAAARSLSTMSTAPSRGDGRSSWWHGTMDDERAGIVACIMIVYS